MNNCLSYEDLERDLYIAVGQMVQKWSAVESRLAHILTLLLTGKSEGRLGETIYYEVPNLKPRIAMLNAAFFTRSDISGETQRHWRQVIEAVERESSERNSLVHGDFIRGSVSDTQIAVAISPKIFSDMKRNHPPIGTMKLGFDTEDVLRHVERMKILYNALWALYAEIPNAEDSRPPLSSGQYMDMWRSARGKRQWPSV